MSVQPHAERDDRHRHRHERFDNHCINSTLQSPTFPSLSFQSAVASIRPSGEKHKVMTAPDTTGLERSGLPVRTSQRWSLSSLYEPQASTFPSGEKATGRAWLGRSWTGIVRRTFPVPTSHRRTFPVLVARRKEPVVRREGQGRDTFGRLLAQFSSRLRCSRIPNPNGPIRSGRKHRRSDERTAGRYAWAEMGFWGIGARREQLAVVREGE